VAAWEWTLEHVTAFTLEAGLISGLVDEIAFPIGEKELFVRKASLIYSALVRVARRKAEAKRDVNRKH